ncbi:MAG: adenine deaminase, partial [Bacteroidales bacterium]|nr:adenine deaminase [Bacteroidales bacterium]
LVDGHLDVLIRRALAAGYKPMDVLRAVTLNPVKHYSLDAGLLQEGDLADLVVVDDLNDFRVRQTWVGGILVAENGESFIKSVEEGRPNHFNARLPELEEMRIPAFPGKLRVIEAYDGQLVTGLLLEEARVMDGEVLSDTDRDILKIAVLNRYSPSLPAFGFVRGFGMKQGAMASTVAHDSHNLICVGTNDVDMLKAMQLLISHQGGIAVVNGDDSLVLPLPVAGIMSEREGYAVAKDYQQLDRMAKTLGSGLRSPFMTLSFMALLVIPALKLSDKGLFNGQIFKFTEVFESL